MKGIPKFCYKSKLYLKKASPTILTCVSITGVILTSVTSVKATPKAIELLENAKNNKGKELTKLEIVKIAGPTYIPSIILGISTIACILGANVLNKKQQAAISSAYALLHNSYKEYKNKVVELYGTESDFTVRKEIAKDKYNDAEIELSEDGEKILFYDEYSGRYFESTMEDVLLAEYHFNRNFALRDYAELNEFYEFLGLDKIDGGDIVGWSKWIGEGTYGYKWVDFNHQLVTMEDNLECYILSMPFEPTEDYMDW